MKKLKKFKKFKKPELPEAVKHPLKDASFPVVGRSKSPEEKVKEALSNVPRITNDTVADHREEVLSSARKYIYPLQHSKHHIVRNSIMIFAFVVVAFFAACTLSLYKFQSTSGFIYDVTRIVPFPIAKTGSQWVSYESYLFELRRNMHYYRTQQQANFDTRDGKAQLMRLKQQAMDRVVQDSYVKQLAAQNNVSVSNQTVSDEVTLLKNENRLGNNDRVFREVLSEFWGWNEADFRRELQQQLLAQAVVAKLDTKTNAQAENALKKLRSGVDFGTLAGQVSEDPATKGSGGQYPSPITLNSHDAPPAITAALFKLKAGQTSGIINSGYSLDIVKALDTSSGSMRAAHIQFNFQDISVYVKPLAAKEPPDKYIKI